MFIIETKNFDATALEAHTQIIAKEYFTLSEVASLENIFPENTPTVEDHILMGIHRDRKGEISIAYSFEDTDMEIICTKDTSN